MKKTHSTITTIYEWANKRYLHINYEYNNWCTRKYTLHTNRVKSIKLIFSCTEIGQKKPPKSGTYLFNPSCSKWPDSCGYKKNTFRFWYWSSNYPLDNKIPNIFSSRNVWTLVIEYAELILLLFERDIEDTELLSTFEIMRSFCCHNYFCCCCCFFSWLCYCRYLYLCCCFCWCFWL